MGKFTPRPAPWENLARLNCFPIGIKHFPRDRRSHRNTRGRVGRQPRRGPVILLPSPIPFDLVGISQYRRIKNLTCIVVQKRAPVLYLKLDPTTVKVEDGFSRNVRTIGHWGTGDLELTLRTKDDLKRAEPLIAKSYEGSWPEIRVIRPAVPELHGGNSLVPATAGRQVAPTRARSIAELGSKHRSRRLRSDGGCHHRRTWRTQALNSPDFPRCIPRWALPELRPRPVQCLMH